MQVLSEFPLSAFPAISAVVFTQSVMVSFLESGDPSYINEDRTFSFIPLRLSVFAAPSQVSTNRYTLSTFQDSTFRQVGDFSLRFINFQLA